MIVEEVTVESLQTETVLSLFGLPDVSRDSLEDEAKRIHAVLTARIPTNDKHRYWFPVIKIKEKYGMKMWPAKLDNSILGQIRFVPSRADIYDIKDMSKCYYDEPIPSNSILLNSKYYTNEVDSCDDVITTAHEFVHWYHHQLYFLIMQLLDKGIVEMSCSSEPIAFDDSISLKDKAYWYAEWQANELSMRLTMPKHLVERAINEYNKDESVQSVHNNADMPFSGMYYQNMIYKLSCDFNVPVEIMKRRLRQLGHDFADGTFITVDDCTYQSFTFAYGTLKENETFIIDRSNYERLLSENKDFAELIESKLFVYTGYVICLNDIKYIEPQFLDGRLYFILSDYAKEHADECCMKFSLDAEVNVTRNPVLYGKNFLCKLKTGTYSEKKNENLKLTSFAMNDMYSYYKMREEQKEARRIIDEMDNENIEGFSGALQFLMNKRKLTSADLSDEQYLNYETLKKYLKGSRKPSLEKIMVICNKLEVQYELAIDLLSRAEKTLNLHCAKDKLYDYLLTITNATLEEWDLILVQNNQSPLENKIE